MANQKKLDVYQKAHSQIKQLYASLELGEKLLNIAEKNQIPVQPLSTSIGDTILGFYTTTQLPKLLETELSINAATAQAIVEDLQEFLGPVYDRENGILPEDATYEQKAFADAKPAATFEKATPTWEVPQNEPAATEPKPATPQPAPANTTTPAAPAATPELPTVPEPEPASNEPIAPMRTMEGDMQKIHGYGAYREQYPTSAHEGTVVRSSQEETLTRRQPNLADVPKVDDSST